MRRSGRHLAWLIGSFVLVAGVLLAGCSGPDARVRGPLQSGDDAARQHALREALNHYRTAAVAEPASLEAQTRRGAMAEALGEFDEALEAYGRAARLEPSALTFYRAGAMAERMGNHGLAVDYLTASLSERRPAPSGWPRPAGTASSASPRCSPARGCPACCPIGFSARSPWVRWS